MTMASQAQLQAMYKAASQAATDATVASSGGHFIVASMLFAVSGAAANGSGSYSNVDTVLALTAAAQAAHVAYQAVLAAVQTPGANATIVVLQSADAVDQTMQAAALSALQWYQDFVTHSDPTIGFSSDQQIAAYSAAVAAQITAQYRLQFAAAGANAPDRATQASLAQTWQLLAAPITKIPRPTKSIGEAGGLDVPGGIIGTFDVNGYWHSGGGFDQFGNYVPPGQEQFVTGPVTPTLPVGLQGFGLTPDQATGRAPLPTPAFTPPAPPVQAMPVLPVATTPVNASPTVPAPGVAGAGYPGGTPTPGLPGSVPSSNTMTVLLAVAAALLALTLFRE